MGLAKRTFPHKLVSIVKFVFIKNIMFIVQCGDLSCAHVRYDPQPQLWSAGTQYSNDQCTIESHFAVFGPKLTTPLALTIAYQLGPACSRMLSSMTIRVRWDSTQDCTLASSAAIKRRTHPSILSFFWLCEGMHCLAGRYTEYYKVYKEGGIPSIY